MKTIPRAFLVACTAIGLAVAAGGVARAGDCASPDDCIAVPDNATKAGAVGTTVAGVIFGMKVLKKKKKGTDVTHHEEEGAKPGAGW